MRQPTLWRANHDILSLLDHSLAMQIQIRGNCYDNQTIIAF